MTAPQDEPSTLSKTPEPPYYAVIFASTLSGDLSGYAETAERMVELAQQQEGFLGVDSARENIGITISYWDSLEAIKNWKHQSEHAQAREQGRRRWYSHFTLRVAKVERAYEL